MTPSFKLDVLLPTDLLKVIPFIESVCEKIFALTGSNEEASKVKLALEEALTNAMRHGNALDPARKVTVCIEASAQEVILNVRDEGAGFDFQNLPDPTRSDHAGKPSGRGVFMMRKFMDEVTFYDGGSGVVMKKRFHQAT
jgi:serine/threonine-protein kinase RsbW